MWTCPLLVWGDSGNPALIQGSGSSHLVPVLGDPVVGSGCSDGAGLIARRSDVCLSDRSFLSFRLSLKIEPGEGSPRFASDKKELAGKRKGALHSEFPSS